MSNKTFFKGAYQQLARAQGTGSKEDFDALASKILPRVKNYALWMQNRYPLAMVDSDDYVQEAMLALWRFLKSYCYICPECDERFKTSNAFVKHCKDEHHAILPPRQRLEDYLNFRIKRYMRNLMLRYLKAGNRSSLMTVYSDDIDLEMPDGFPLPDKMYETRNRIRRLGEQVSREQNAKVRYFVESMLTGTDAGDIYNGMVEKGILGSVGSARVAISNLKAKGLFEVYRTILTG